MPTLPGGASMYVMSALKTSRELIRHSYYRYEFATVAVTHSLFALEHVLAERLTTNEPRSRPRPKVWQNRRSGLHAASGRSQLVTSRRHPCCRYESVCRPSARGHEAT
ncbi:hypothetical protein GCM10010347_63190 [Streptomyces cirratus]|uniref:Uncharacterized protein n=1 Tax=Streptomyces cirratus TaxID=68187 RepID=A0ABQ3F566_9ACTN|nr:hypothetical protein GCM10010347_63190 [Streptomyces cirratus]